MGNADVNNFRNTRFIYTYSVLGTKGRFLQVGDNDVGAFSGTTLAAEILDSDLEPAQFVQWQCIFFTQNSDYPNQLNKRPAPLPRETPTLRMDPRATSYRRHRR
jgi:hypothetical protein